MKSLTIILASGLPLRPERPSSFERQLKLLADGSAARGHRAVVTGPEAAADKADAAILLGYPDQFRDLLGGPEGETPLFLWTQCSRPPNPRAFSGCTAVPLSPLTAAFLQDAGVAHIGPVIPHGVDTAFFSPLDDGKRAGIKRSLGLDGRFVIGAVGANSHRKRFDLIIEAIARFAASRQDMALLIKTDRASGFDGTDLPGIAEKAGAADRLAIIEGEESDARMRELYGAMDLFVNLSEWEGFCVPVLEAMSMGVPVLTHSVQGPGEIVPYGDLMARDSVCTADQGSRLLAANPDTAAALMKKAAADPELRRRLGEKGRDEAVRQYDIRRIAGLWTDLITGNQRYWQ